MPAPVSNTQQQQGQLSRELSESEQMNKKLIATLLKSVIKGGDPTVAKIFEPENNSEENNERKCSCNPNPQ
ncbi:hypothetical protein RR46_04384 [Papilio xuthus]|uniref:Uncharacterized protein n=1 Tax=Papilio xuthus TaxID=66420 RepID=A0A194PLK5_PAPXU|nr:hypothetical protein RR46_04384 [Papilio xuthus]